MLLIIHSITSAEIDEKTKTGILLDRSLCCFFFSYCQKKERGTHKKQTKNQTLIQKKKRKRKSEINKQQEYACRQKDVCVENK